jgi:CelD/BcsL family acetyltransferase involved in cellulose biosynthesis
MRGELEWDFATGIDSGLSMRDELASLHQASWSFKGKPGVFGSLRFLAFHRELISRALPQGNIDLVRISAGGHSIGVVYYFIYRGRVYYYQSGFSYGDDARLKPGLTTHYLMIMEYQRRGLLEYDFLAGNERYKMSLATHARDLLWTTIAFHNAKMRSLALLKTFKRAYERIARSS